MKGEMRRPPREQVDIAAAWLRSNEGDGGEAEACAAVAAWIEHEAYEGELRSAARKGGVSVARLRRKLAEQSGR